MPGHRSTQFFRKFAKNLPTNRNGFRAQFEIATPDDRRHLCFSFFISTIFVKMKLNISYPANGTQKLIEVDDERKLRVFMDRRMGQEVPGDSVGDEFKGYIFKI